MIISFNTLPTEIIEYVFEYFESYWHQLLMSVSREWYHIIKGIRRRKKLSKIRYSIVLSSFSKPIFDWCLAQGLNNKNSILCYYLALKGDFDLLKYVYGKGFPIHIYNKQHMEYKICMKFL